MRDKLPRGWAIASLSSLVSSTGEMCDGDWVESKDQDPRGDVRLIQLADVGSGVFLDKSDRYLTSAKASELNCTFLQAGDVLISRLGEPLGKTCLFPPVSQACVTVVDVHVFRSGHVGVNHKWLVHFLNSPSVRREVDRQSSGTTRKRITGQKLKDLEIPIPPSNEQNRIASKIDELFSRIEEGERTLDRVQKLVERYRQSVLKSAVTGELTREWREQRQGHLESSEVLLQRLLKARRDAWEMAELRKMKAKGIKRADDKWRQKYQEPTEPKIALQASLPRSWAQLSVEQATRGDRPVAYGVLQPGEDTSSGTPLVRVCDVAEGAVDTQNLKRISQQIAGDFPRTKLHGGEVLLTIVGTIGRSAVVPMTLAGANVARAVAVMVPSEGVASEWLEICLRYEKTRQLLTETAREVARKTLNLEQLREYAVPVPSAAEQLEATSRVSALLSRASAVERDIRSQIAAADSLRQVVLKAAFCGGLVPQDTKDEPASFILDRIAERNSGRRNRRTKAEHAA